MRLFPALLPLLAVAGAAAAQAPAAKPAAKPVARPAAEPRAVAIFMAEQMVALRAATDGRVVSVGATEGSPVRKGAVLVQLDDREQRARVSLAAKAAGSSADARAAEVRRQEAQARLEGTQKASAKGAATDWELRQARAAAEQAGLESRAAQDRQSVEGQRLSLEKVMLENYVARAPFDGRVTRIGARPGMSVRKSDVLATVVNMSTLRGETFVPVARYSGLKQGATYPVVFAAPFSRTLPATLIYIDPVIDGGQVRAVFRLQNTGEALPSGLQGSVILKPLAK
ncbi:efflux RND transporter periplasmic adaptor subunit [Sandaracinobacter neustonicus]|nr:efflux RND transporter periplasmic adaptor subunit [Sandaracinobacter neustonicus]